VLFGHDIKVGRDCAPMHEVLGINGDPGVAVVAHHRRTCVCRDIGWDGVDWGIVYFKLRDRIFKDLLMWSRG